MQLSAAQIETICDYKRISSVTLVDYKETHSLVKNAETGEIIGHLHDEGVAIIDRNRGYAVVQRNGGIGFRDGRYYCHLDC